MTRITLSIHQDLLNEIDKAAERDYTTRSDLIRIGMLWYLRPQGPELKQVDPDMILKTLQRRQRMRQLRKEQAEGLYDDLDVYDS